jgi:hypothetical protein
MRGLGSSLLHITRRRIVWPVPPQGEMARAVDESGARITWGQPPPAVQPSEAREGRHNLAQGVSPG